MKAQIHELRTRIDGLAQLVKTLDRPVNILINPLNPEMSKNELLREIAKYGGAVFSIPTESKIEQIGTGLSFLAESYKSLLLAKAWLGKILEELGEKQLSKKYPVGVVGKTSRDAFFLAVEKGLDAKNRSECILISTPSHFKSWVFSELILPEDLYGFSEQMLMAIKYGKEQVFVPKTVDDIEPTDDRSTLTEVYYKMNAQFNVKTIFDDENNAIGESSRSYIEKIDWLREEINKIRYDAEIKVIGHFLISERVWMHLNEARFHLGFELSQIKEQSK